MQNRALLLLVLASCTAIFGVLAVDSVSAVAHTPGFYRQLEVWASPSLQALAEGNATGIAVAGLGVDYSGNTSAGEVHVDLAGFKFRNPEDRSDLSNSLSFYFGYLKANAEWDNSTATASLNGTLLEVIASFNTIIVYYDNDGTDGFQISNLGDDFLCLQPDRVKFDCVDTSGSAIDMKDLNWGGIIVTNTSCPAGYNANCTIYSAKTTSTDGTAAFTLRLASEPVLINGVRVEPNYGKIDVEINYPWAAKEARLQLPSRAKLALVGVTAGKAADGQAVWAKVDGHDAVAYNADGKGAYFSWDGTAVIGNSKSGSVLVQGISGESIANLDCSNNKCGFAVLVYVPLQLGVGIWKAFGWTTNVILFSWNDIKPAKVFWDPAIGMKPETIKVDSAAFALAPSVVVAVILSVVAHLFHEY